MKSLKTSILRSKTGFTLIEVLVVLGIFVIIASLGLFLSMDYYRSFTFSSERDLLVSTLEKARSQAVSNVDEKVHGVHHDAAGHNYVIFQADSGTPTFDPADPMNEAIGYNSNISVSWSGDAVFSQLTGELVGASAQTYILSTNSDSATITTNAEGQIEW